MGREKVRLIFILAGSVQESEGVQVVGMIKCLSGEYVNVNCALQLVAEGAVERVVMSKHHGYNIVVRILEQAGSGFTHEQQSEQQKCSWMLGRRART